jgi:hypothetical protein
MKPRLSNQRTTALTMVEVLVVIVVLAVFAAVLLPTLAHRERLRRIPCVSNLKQIGLSYLIWAGDNGDKYPMRVSVTNGGTMELVATGNVAAVFEVMSNELYTPKLLICPEDTHRVWATNFSAGFDNSHISYFVGVDADQTSSQMLLSGDDNFAIGGVPVKSGLLLLATNTPVSWTAARHVRQGNIGLADGSVQQVITDGLQKVLQQTGATNRLAIP